MKVVSHTCRKAVAAFAAAGAFSLGAGAVSAATATIDFGTSSGLISSPYVEDNFAIAGTDLFLSTFGNPAASIGLREATLTLTRIGGGFFSLVSFDYSCGSTDGCDFSVGNSAITSGSPQLDVFTTFTAPAGDFTNLAALVFTSSNSTHLIDNIVVSYEEMTPIPLPAALPLLLAGVGGLGLMARRNRKVA